MMRDGTRRDFLKTTAIGTASISVAAACSPKSEPAPGSPAPGAPEMAAPQVSAPLGTNPQGRIASSAGEMDRRWNAVREVMKRDRIDYLVIRNDEAWLGGPIKWFTDANASNNYPVTAIFPVDDEMTVIEQGAPGESLKGSPGVPRGVKKRLTMNYMPSAPYTSVYDADLAVGVLKEKKGAVIGLVGKEFIPVSFYELLAKGLPGAKFMNATDQINALMAIKSPEELELIKGVAAIQDAALEHVRKTLRPGMKPYELFAETQYACSRQGAYRYVINISTRPQEAGSGPGDGTIQAGDQVSLLIETNGPSGHWCELARPISMGKPSQQLQDAFGLALEAQKVSLDLLKPGANCKDIWDSNNAFLVKRGYQPETRLYAHGQGYHFVEQPLIRNDEPMKIQANMNIVVHPSANNGKVSAGITDNYITTESGVGPCIHKSPKEIVVI